MMRGFWKSFFFAALLAAVLIGPVSAASADTLTLPSGLKEIGAEAFMGDTSLEQVILPAGMTRIGEHAFANSSLTSITLPDSLTYIADNAFEGCAGVHATVSYDTKAYTYALDHGFLSNDLRVDKTMVHRLSATSGTYSFSVASDRKWTVTAEDDWLSPTIYDRTTLRIRLSKNTDGAERTGTVVVSNGVNSQTITVYQATISEPPTANGLSSVASAPTELPYAVQSVSVNRVYEGTCLFFEIYKVNADGTKTFQARRYYTNTAYARVVLTPVTDYCTMLPGGTYCINIFECPTSLMSYCGNRIHISSYYIRYENNVPAGAPYTPSHSVSASTKKQINASWSAVNNADSYQVYYSATNDINTAQAVTGITETNYTITNLDDGIVYYTWVRAVNSKGMSGASAVKSIITKPAPPTQNAPTVSGNSITLSWSESTGASSYRLYYNTVNDFDSATIINGIQDCSYTLENLEYNKTYYTWVAAVNSSGSRWFITAKSAVTESEP